MLGCIVLYLILNLMSPQGVDIPKTASVLGYCMLPLVMLSSLSTLFTLKYALDDYTNMFYFPPSLNLIIRITNALFALESH